MYHAKLLDCTLRDGAYLIDKEFGDDNIKGIISGLMDSHVDIIEIGFFQNDGFGTGKTVFKNSKDAKRFVPSNKGKTLFTVLADYSRYSMDNLDGCDPESIDGVRECFFKKERYDAINYCKLIKQKGYKCFVQPVDILGYSDQELIELIELVNECEPYCFSIVDTFGSMYQEDLQRVFEIINHNLVQSCKVGFHSHNNMQLSSSLSQEFLRLSFGKREVIVDSTISGMGRGAGNTPTELIAQYMVDKLGYHYDIDALLDVIDNHIDNIKSRCSWGYSTSFFLAGTYSAHVNNIAYLSAKNSICHKDIRFILNKIGSEKRKRYDYDLLEKTYLEYMQSNIDDLNDLKRLSGLLKGRNVLILAPGLSVIGDINKIIEFINKENPIVISVNFIHPVIKSDYLFISNFRRYSNLVNNLQSFEGNVIFSSNIRISETHLEGEDIFRISFSRLIKCGWWEHLDNSTMMLLRLLDNCSLKSIALAGFDGYTNNQSKTVNYYSEKMELSSVKENYNQINKEIRDMYIDYIQTRSKKAPIFFLTKSRYNDEGN